MQGLVMIRPAIAIFVLWMGLISPHTTVVAAEDPHSGNFLWEICGDEASPADKWACLTLVTGFADGYEFGSRRSPLKAICRPSGVTNNQTVTVVVAYLRAHPDRRQAVGEGLIVLALHEAWPCPNGVRAVWDPNRQAMVISSPAAKRPSPPTKKPSPPTKRPSKKP